MKSEVVKCNDPVRKLIKHNQTDYGVLYFMYIIPTKQKLVVLKSSKDNYIMLDSDNDNDIGFAIDTSIECDDDIEFEIVPRNYTVKLRND